MDLRAELQSARLVEDVEIDEYTPQGLIFRLQDNPRKPLSARYWGADDSKWVPNVVATLDFNQDILTGEWPPGGSKVLLVVDADNIISLFAWERGADYRFWSPWMTGSLAGFICEPPARPLPRQADSFMGANRGWESWDGCLVPAAELDTLRGTTQPNTALPVTEEQEQPQTAMKKPPQFGFRMDHQTFQALRSLAPELAGAHWPGLTPEGQRAWDNGDLGAVYNTGSYVEEDVNGDGQSDAVLLLEVPQASGVEESYLLVATRRIPGVPWTRVGLVRLPPPELHEWSIMDAIEQQAHDPQLAAFFKTERQSPELAVQESGVSPAADSATTRPIAEWVARLTDPDPRVRLEAAEALGRLGPEAAVAIEPLVQRFYDPEELVRDAAGSSLAQIGPASVPALRQLVLREGSTHGRHDPGARSQRLAVALLGRLMPVTDEAVSLAADVCRDRAIHDLVRHDACLSLAALGARELRVRQEAIETLRRVFQEADADLSLRTELVYALGRLGPEPSVVATLAHALHDREFFIRRAARRHTCAVRGLGTLSVAGASHRPQRCRS
ncbi:MAG: HEAT repeat domain-containing protein [Candidatus Omnitrophica bacterium]|nr:HEAT repeat domain-containing protein [Candidatus Omnitrophota bacterium]